MTRGATHRPRASDDSATYLDAHVHCYPSEVIADPMEWARKQGEPHWGQLVTEGPQGWADPEALLRAMDDSGIARVLLQAWYWENPETAKKQNDWHSEWVGRYPDRFSACAAVHPAFGDITETLRAAAGWGACGVGECLPQVQTTDGWNHPGWQEILQWTTTAGWPLCLHLTEPVGHSYPGRVETPLMEIVDLFEKHPLQKWLCAHWGGGLPFYSMNMRVRKALKNVWFDSAASPLLYDKRVWRAACDLVGPEKILFGSDFPLRLFPRKQPEPGWKLLLEEFEGGGLTPHERQLIGHDNMARLFRLS